MSKLTFVCQVYHPDAQATSQLFTPLMEGLATMGHDVTVLCGYPSKFPRNVKCLKRETRHGVKIIRCGFRAASKKNYFSRFLAYFSFLFGVFFCLLGEARNSINFGVTNPPFVSWVLFLIKIIKGNKYIYMLLDLHPEGMVALGALRKQSILVKIWMAINKISYLNAERLIVLGRDMIPKLSSEYAINPKDFLYIPHWSASEISSPIPIDTTKFFSAWGLKGRFVVQYSGNMGLWHDIDTFVRAADALREHTNIVFVFIGGGMRLSSAQELANSLNLSNIKWYDFVDLNDLEQSLSSCHLSLISLRNGLEGVAVPCKLYGILASGRAVIAQVPADSEVAMTIRDNNCGVVVEPGDYRALANAIFQLSNNQKIVTEFGFNAFEAYKANFRIANSVSAFHRAFNVY